MRNGLLGSVFLFLGSATLLHAQTATVPVSSYVTPGAAITTPAAKEAPAAPPRWRPIANLIARWNERHQSPAQCSPDANTDFAAARPAQPVNSVAPLTFIRAPIMPTVQPAKTASIVPVALFPGPLAETEEGPAKPSPDPAVPAMATDSLQMMLPAVTVPASVPTVVHPSVPLPSETPAPAPIQPLPDVKQAKELPLPAPIVPLPLPVPAAPAPAPAQSAPLPLPAAEKPLPQPTPQETLPLPEPQSVDVPAPSEQLPLPEKEEPLPSVPEEPSHTFAETTVDSGTVAGGDTVLTLDPAEPAMFCASEGNNTAWVKVDYLLWWLRSGPVNSPLVTTGSPTDAFPGALHQPGTHVQFGDHALDDGMFSGLRFSAGVELYNGLNLEGSYFDLEQRSVQFGLGSNAAGAPLIARPLNSQTMLENALVVSNPGPAGLPVAGGVGVAAHTHLQGYEVNLATNLWCDGSLRLGVLAGFRALDLNEDLTIQDTSVPLAPGALTFLGKPVNPGSAVTTFDGFGAVNHFYGGQIGGRLDWNYDRFSLNVVGKIALGDTQQMVNIGGSSSLLMPGSILTAPGGVLALPSNSGSHFRNEFGVVPEIGINFAWDLTPQIKATVGYSFVYWNDVARPGNQIDHSINPAQAPTAPGFTGATGSHPAFSFHESDFWAQGINVGLEFRF